LASGPAGIVAAAAITFPGCDSPEVVAVDYSEHRGHITGQNSDFENSNRKVSDSETAMDLDTISGQNGAQVVKGKNSLSHIAGPVKVNYANIDDFDERAFGILAKELLDTHPAINIERIPQSDQQYSPNSVILDLYERGFIGELPDVFQAQWGRPLIQRFVEQDKLIPVDDIFQSSVLRNQYPDRFLSVGEVKGSIWGVPMSIGRSNLMWFDVQFFESTGIDSPSHWNNWGEAFEAMSQIKELGVIPFAVDKSDPLHFAHIFENILLSELGPLPYTKLFSGEVSWLDSGVSKCLNILKKLLVDFADPNAGTREHDDALDAVLSKRSVLTIFNEQGLKLLYRKGVDTGVSFCPSPGTRGVFSFVSNAFYASRLTTNPEAVAAWLTLVSNRHLQDQYNQMRVSLPPRFDADKSMYTEDQRRLLHDWKRDYIVPSVVFGLASDLLGHSNFVNALQFFSRRLDVESVQKYLADRCSFGTSCR